MPDDIQRYERRVLNEETTALRKQMQDRIESTEARVRELEARDRQVAGQLVRHWHEHAEACAECEPLRRDPDYVCREWRPTLDALCPARQAGEVEND